MKKQEKINFVKSLTDNLEKATSYVLIDFSGMDVASQQELKKRLKAVNAKLIVVKNTLLKRAAKEVKTPEEVLTDTVLSGQTALVITQEDPLSPIQVLGKFISEFELPQLKVGIIEGLFQDKENLLKLSKLPSKDVLLAEVVGAIAGPAYNLVSALDANMQKLVYILEKKTQKGGDWYGRKEKTIS